MAAGPRGFGRKEDQSGWQRYGKILLLSKYIPKAVCKTYDPVYLRAASTAAILQSSANIKARKLISARV